MHHRIEATLSGPVASMQSSKKGRRFGSGSSACAMSSQWMYRCNEALICKVEAYWPQHCAGCKDSQPGETSPELLETKTNSIGRGITKPIPELQGQDERSVRDVGLGGGSGVGVA
jgi:hypothetical protein